LGAQSADAPGDVAATGHQSTAGWRANPERKQAMAKYMFQARYSAEGAKGLVRDGATGRRAAIEKACIAAGGKLESMYYAFGGIDVYATADLPNNTAAAALALAVNQAGGASVNTVVLMTVAEVDEAAKQAIAYRPPGG
jgi:uncharacterized protein with GYD domain